jgi:DNA-directed RNA polymerase specialized sigma24 family protein
MGRPADHPGTLLVAFLRVDGGRPRSRPASALRTLVQGLKEWAPRFLRRLLHRSWREEVCADAVQHLLLAITEGKADHLAAADETRAVRWLRRVLLNFAVDQIRHASRAVPMHDGTRGGHGDTFEAAICARDEFARLADKLSREAQFTASPRTARQRARLVDEYFASVLARPAGPAPTAPSNAVDQRRCRGRRAATVAWHAFRDAEVEAEEFRDLAAALGLEADAPSAGGRKQALDGCGAARR